MTNETAIMTLTEEKERCQIFIDSGLFKDTKEVSQAIVKIWAGRSIGLSDYEAMSSLNIISGQITLSGNVQASFIKSNPKYNYRILIANAKECEIEFIEDGEVMGTSEYTFEEASKITFRDYKTGKNKSLTDKDNWKNYPSDMLFNRCISRGRRRFCPDVFGGSRVYDPEELDNVEPRNITPPEFADRIEKDKPVVEEKTIVDVEETEPELSATIVDHETLLIVKNPIIPYDVIKDIKTPWDAMGTITDYVIGLSDSNLSEKVTDIIKKYVPDWADVDFKDIDEQIAIDLVEELTGYKYEVTND